MTHTFEWGNTGIEFCAQLEPRVKKTKYSVTLVKTRFKPSGIRIEGDRLHEVMISHIMLGPTSLTTTPFSLSTIRSFKSYVDGRITENVIRLGDTLSFWLENVGKSRVIVRLYIDGEKTN